MNGVMPKYTPFWKRTVQHVLFKATRYEDPESDLTERIWRYGAKIYFTQYLKTISFKITLDQI